jgi:CubicO group peptidase (beta-lactamase class C family)
VPGSAHQYSNFGYVLLQQLVEDVGGKPFARFMSEDLFAPLGMAASTFDQSLPNRHPAGAASPHSPDGRAHAQTLHPSALGQGGLWTTPSDLCLLAIELMRAQRGEDPRLLDPAGIRAALSVEREIDPARNMSFSRQGLGFFLLPTAGGFAFCHPGFNAPGATCLFLGFPETGQGVAIMANGARGLELSLEVLSALAVEYAWPVILAD